MFNLKQAALIRGPAGDPLPMPFPGLERLGTRFLRGQLGLIAAAPGVGKSLFALTYALRSRVPTLYFSADSDSFVQLSRSISILGNLDYEQAKERAATGNLEGVPGLDKLPIWFDFEPGPSVGLIHDKLDAYAERFEEFPDLVVIDNVTDVRTGGDNDADPFAGLEALMSELHEVARKTGTFILGLHHVTGKYNDGDVIIPLSGIKGQIGRVPEIVLTIHRDDSEYGPSTMCVSPVKNRSGKSNPSGSTFAEFGFDGSKMRIEV